MKRSQVDLTIIGAGPVGLMCAYLARKCGLTTIIIDKSDAPLEVGRADALNARTLQLLEVADLFDEIYPLGKPCNTSSVWKNGKFISRQSSWWDELEGCLHRHFLMLGQSYIENTLDEKLTSVDAAVKRSTEVENIEILDNGCLTKLSNGEEVKSQYVIGADGSRSFVRNHFQVPFEIVRPQIIWAVVDGVIESDFKKVPELIVFQTETSDVAWIPREGNIDRFYVRMDVKDFSFDEVLRKINRAMSPHVLRFKEVVWFSQFSVKESVAENFSISERVFLAGDSCHVHSVNGGQGLNTGLADAFNLIWKLNMVIKNKASKELLSTYEEERKPVALSVIESSGELVRSTKYSKSGTHAQDYVKIVEKRSDNITGMGIRYEAEGLIGSRLFDFEIYAGVEKKRLYSLLDYSKYTLLVFGEVRLHFDIPDCINILNVHKEWSEGAYYTEDKTYSGMAVLVRPDAYIEKIVSVKDANTVNFTYFFQNNKISL